MGELKKPAESAAADLAPLTLIQRLRRLVIKAARVAALTYLLVMVLLMIFEEKLIFFPSRYPEGNWLPDRLNFEDVEFRTQDGVRLHGWYCPVKEPLAVVLVSHGNAGNLSDRAEEIQLWQQHCHVSIFIYDYRGYGRSEGSPNEPGLYADARGAYRWLAEEKMVTAEEIVLRGESIGSAVSLQLALEVPCRALIMESPFTSAVAMGQRSFPWLPVRWMMRNPFDSISKIDQYHGPLLITHGTRDSIVPFEMGKTLFDRANQPKKFYPVPDADHNDVPFVGGRRYFASINEFLSGL